MACYRINEDGTVSVGSDGFIPNGFTEYTVGAEPQELKDALALEDKEKEFLAWKESRAKAVSEIKVTVDNMVFDGDETSQTRMSRAITSLRDNETQPWTLANDENVLVTKEQLIEALRLAGTEQTRLWVYPNK